MDFFSLFLIALGLAMDTFAVSLGISTCNQQRDWRQILRLSFHFGLFQGLMTLLGWLGGSLIAKWIVQIDHWIIFGLLGWVGAHMIVSSFSKGEQIKRSDPSRGWSLILLSVATSLDALALGIGMAFLPIQIGWASLLIAGVSFLLSTVGGLTGCSLGMKFGRRMELLGGILLIGIGIRILTSHLLTG